MTFDHHSRCHHNLYRMSCDDFDELLSFARRCCQICETPEAETRRRQLVIDHDPNYSPIAVRGLLCDKCNALMRRFDERKSVDERCFIYRNRAWFLRVLIDRRARQFQVASS